MIAILNPALRKKEFDRIYDLVTGKRTMPAVSYPPRTFHEIHLSDLEWDGGCPLLAYLSRTMDEKPSYSELSILRFLRGRVVERALSNELEPVEKDGILCTLDGFDDEHGFIERKSTIKDSDGFSPIASYPHWTSRCRGYLAATGAEHINLTALFWIGNTWTAKRRGVEHIQIELKCWKLMPENDEVAKHWAEIIRRKEILRKALDSGDPKELVEATKKHKPAWFSCANCEYNQEPNVCPINRYL